MLWLLQVVNYVEDETVEYEILSPIVVPAPTYELAKALGLLIVEKLSRHYSTTLGVEDPIPLDDVTKWEGEAEVRECATCREPTLVPSGADGLCWTCEQRVKEIDP